MNQKPRKVATANVERDFYKLLNNSNFGIDCRNNIGNCYLEPIYDDFCEISYIKNYTAIFNDDTFRNCFSPTLLREEITSTFDSKTFELNNEDPTYEACKNIMKDKKLKSSMLLTATKKTRESKRETFKMWRIISAIC